MGGGESLLDLEALKGIAVSRGHALEFVLQDEYIIETGDTGEYARVGADLASAVSGACVGMDHLVLDLTFDRPVETKEIYIDQILAAFWKRLVELDRITPLHHRCASRNCAVLVL